MSLHNGERIAGKYLKIFIEHLNISRTIPTAKVTFLSIEDELVRHLFKCGKNIDPSLDKKRYLFALPIHLMNEEIEIILREFALVIKFYSDRNYALCDGTLENKIIKRLNCVTDYYQAMRVEGLETNPFPQMAAWSYQKLLLGTVTRDELLKSTGFRMPGKERVHDDELKQTVSFGSQVDRLEYKGV